MIRTVCATRYVTPLREGGSLPALIEADDDGMYVLKFRGAGQGPKSLIAELLCGLLGQQLGLPVPELVFVELDGALGRNEPDGEIQALVEGSAGLNLGLDYLPGALGFEALAVGAIDPALASAIVWFDGLVMNVDRTPRNPNLLLWHRQLWMIDHGAALYLHHTWGDYRSRLRSRMTSINQHILLPVASQIAEADARLAPLINDQMITQVVDAIPDQWLGNEPAFADLATQRAAYREYLLARLEPPRLFVEEAIHAHSKRI